MSNSQTNKQQVPVRELGVPYERNYFELQALYTDGSGRWSCINRRDTIEEARIAKKEAMEQRRNLQWFIDQGPTPKWRIVEVRAVCTVKEFL